jgi:serine/threonine protein kinase
MCVLLYFRLSQQACHERGMVHKDIKVENIMLLNEDIREPPQAVLIDLGISFILIFIV